MTVYKKIKPKAGCRQNLLKNLLLCSYCESKKYEVPFGPQVTTSTFKNILNV